MRRSIDTPKREYSTAADAARWLGLTESALDRAVRRHPLCGPINTGTRQRPRWQYHWCSLFLLSCLLQREQAAGAVDPAEREEDADGG